MDSKGNVRHFFGVLFAWRGLESCCCSGVSEPASKGLAPMVSELRPQLGCRTKGDVKQFFGMRFAWHGLESCCCSGVSEPASKGLAPMVSELRPQLGCVPPKAFEAGDSSFRGLESCCCSAVLEGARPMALQRKASWQCLLLTLFFCDLDGALPF